MPSISWSTRKLSTSRFRCELLEGSSRIFRVRVGVFWLLSLWYYPVEGNNWKKSQWIDARWKMDRKMKKEKNRKRNEVKMVWIEFRKPPKNRIFATMILKRILQIFQRLLEKVGSVTAWNTPIWNTKRESHVKFWKANEMLYNKCLLPGLANWMIRSFIPSFEKGNTNGHLCRVNYVDGMMKGVWNQLLTSPNVPHPFTRLLISTSSVCSMLTQCASYWIIHSHQYVILYQRDFSFFLLLLLPILLLHSIVIFWEESHSMRWE